MILPTSVRKTPRPIGYLHRDLILPDGTREKRAIRYASLADALTQALDYVQKHWEFYRAMYEEQ